MPRVPSTTIPSARRLARVLGPPADVLGQVLARWLDFRTRNVGRILESADRKLGDRAEGTGSVPVRVAGAIFEEGSYCDDQVVSEYLGGVLASSKSGVSRDDRGTRWVKLITSLSTYEIRLHYVLYSAPRAVYVQRPQRTDWGNGQSYGELRVVMSQLDVMKAMDFTPEAPAGEIMAEAMFALHREDLITKWVMGPSEEAQRNLGRMAGPPGFLLCFAPTTVGVQLYMWAQGRGSEWFHFDWPDVALPDIGVLSPTAQALQDLPPLSFPPADNAGLST